MAYMESIDFSYAGKYSSDFGIYNVSLDSGMFQEEFVAARSIIETRVRGNPKPYFSGLEYEPLTLSLSFAFGDTWNEAKIREVARWIGGQTYYKPLWFVEYPNRIFYCMAVDDLQLVHNGLKQGYITLTMRCDSAYTYSPFFVSNIYDYSSNVVGGTELKFINSGDLVCKPEMWITKVGSGGEVRIVNATNGNKEFKFSSGLIDGEIVYVNNETEDIESSLTNVYRFGLFNNQYLEMALGVNTLRVYGNVKISFRYQFKTLQG